MVLGIEVGKDFMRLAEVEHREQGFFLSRLAEAKLETLQVDELVQKLSLLISEESIMSRISSVAIDTKLMVRDTIEIDSQLAPDEISSMVKAEVDFHNMFSGQAYIPAYEITNAAAASHKEIFYAAVETRILSALRDACTRCGLDLQFVDLDHSCSEITVNKLWRALGNYLLITVKSDQVEASLCEKGERVSYKYLVYSGEPFYFVTKLAQELENQSKQDIERIFVTGDSADTFLMDLLRKNVDSRYELLNPTEGLLLSSVANDSKELQAHPHHFSHVIGAALK